ncbi:unnamed protein product [Adineta steineri]|uniref:N-terminal methionine N(alpha)-acetyltransferase NatE n=1 Tax=Adineta steineri TaxID=433720 RepID=A0A813VMY1_9BILA|nr:unnamed protein product [Adineta steineri]CAF1005165.1 unnamed protein product [Adineta steineri]CAF3599549.1 unnamed protein product [Adineta steineri]CAF3614816.1 unnamed protein product [Adineta steineri]
MNFVYDQSSTISIYHNSIFSLADVESVLEPLFGNYYGKEKLAAIISSVDHIWCVHDRRINQYVACALVQSHNEKDVLYIKLFGVAISSQGQGIGTRLLKAIKKWARQANYFAVILHTQINNDKAIGLYEKLGFEKQYLFKDFFRPREIPLSLYIHEPDAYQMILYLQ